MSERHLHGAHDAPHGEAPQGVDREIHVKTFFWFGVAFVGLTVVSLLAMWILFGVLARRADRRDPAPSPIEEANRRRLPPGPNLQTTPEKDLASMRAAENARLHGYGWVDESQGIAHIPIERAMEILAQRGATATIEVAPAPATDPAAAPAAAPAANEGIE